MSRSPTPFILGWEEWLALPELGLPAVKAKVDTGARSSALHAFMFETFGPASAPMVRFGIHPVPGNDDIEIYCSAPIVDKREVTSSNGEKETRLFIRTVIEMGGREWPVEIGLTNREAMSYRMLLGRQAIRADMMVDPAASFRQPKLSYRLYRNLPRRDPVPRALRIALLAGKAETPSEKRLAAAAAARGHVLERLDLARLVLDLEGPEPVLRLGRTVVGHYDAVIPRLGVSAGQLGAAAVRQLELTGSFAVNPGDALDLRANPYSLRQALHAAGIPHELPRPASAGATPKRRGERAAVAADAAAIHRVLVIGGRANSSNVLTKSEVRATSGRSVADLRAGMALAERTAAVLRLGLVSIDVAMREAGPVVVRLGTRPMLAPSRRIGGAPPADAVINLIEARVRSWVRR